MTEPTSTAAAHVSQATVVTRAAARYAGQLASHFGHQAEIRTETEGSRIVLTVGSCLLVAGDHALELRARSRTADGVERRARCPSSSVAMTVCC